MSTSSMSEVSRPVAGADHPVAGVPCSVAGADHPVAGVPCSVAGADHPVAGVSPCGWGALLCGWS